MPEIRASLLIAASGLAVTFAVPASGQAVPDCMFATGLGGKLYRVDAGPEGSEFVGDIGPVAPDALINRLTIAGPNLAYTIDTENEVLHGIRLSDATVVSSSPLDQPMWVSSRALAIAPDGVLWGVLPGAQLRTIDPATGVTTLIGAITGATYIEGMNTINATPIAMGTKNRATCSMIC